MKKISRSYFKVKRLILGNGKTQNGGFFPIAPAFAPLAADLIGKITGRDKKNVNKRPHQPSRQITLVSKRR